jgi:hypothetical protein
LALDADGELEPGIVRGCQDHDARR